MLGASQLAMASLLATNRTPINQLKQANKENTDSINGFSSDEMKEKKEIGKEIERKRKFYRKIQTAGEEGWRRSEGRRRWWLWGRREEEGKVGNVVFNKY